MFNLLKMHLFRARRYKLTWILPIVLILILALVFGIEALVMRLSYSDMAEGALLSAPELSVDFFTTTVSMLKAQIIPMMLCMFILLFLSIDRSTGYIKNIVGYLDNKVGVAGASLLLAAIYLLGLILVTALVSLISCILIYDRIEFYDFGTFISFLGVFYLSTLAVIMLLIMLADLMNRHIMVMVLGVLFIVFEPIIYLPINLLIDYLTESTFDLAAYLPMLGSLLLLPGKSNPDLLIRLALISAGLLIGSFVLDVVALKKKDI